MDKQHQCHILPLFPEKPEAKPLKKEKPIFEWKSTLFFLTILFLLLWNMNP